MDGHDERIETGVQLVRDLYERMSAQEILGYASDFDYWASQPGMVLCAPGLRLAANVLRFAIGNAGETDHRG